MKVQVSLVALMSLLSLSAAPATAPAESKEEMNKRVILDFYDKAINQKDFDAAKVHFGLRYTQHNPMAADGPEGLRAFLEILKKTNPQYRSEIKKVFADGDYVILHVHAKARPDDRGHAVVDIFKLEDGKVVEHWDVVQPIPEKPANNNGMF